MIRKFKSWRGLSLVNLLALIGIYALVVILIRQFILDPQLISLIIIVLIMFVAAMAYVNYITLQLRKRMKEFYIRKLFGARDDQILLQLMLESVVLTGFLAISGLVLAEVATPWCGRILGSDMALQPISFGLQTLIVLEIVIPIGVIGANFPIQSFIRYLKQNFAKLSSKVY